MIKLRNLNKDNKDVTSMIFANTKDGKTLYSMGISKKQPDGNWLSGYIPVSFNKDVVLENKTQIIIKDAILDFYKKENQTIPYVRVFKFEVYQEVIEDDNLPF